MAAKKPMRPTFAEIAAEVPEISAPVEQFSWSIPRPWITVDGHRWHLRGHVAHEGKDLRKLLRDAHLLAFHDYVGKRSPIAQEDREAFWLRAASLMEDSDYSEFVGYEYGTPDGDRCLVVYESC